MSFFSFFSKFGKTLASPAVAQDTAFAGVIVSAFNPAIGSLLQSVAGAAYMIETQAAAAKAAGEPPLTGAQKKDAVKAIVDIAAPVAIQAISTATGKPTDGAQLAPAIDSMIDLAVKIYNDLGIFKHAVPAPIQVVQDAIAKKAV